MFTLTPREVFRSLSIMVALLLGAHIAVHVAYYATGQSDLVWPLLALFNVGRDGNIPTVFSFLIMFLATGMLAAIAFSETRQRRSPSLHHYWWGLTAIFLFLACDESIELHERLIVPAREAFHLSGIFYYAWVIPYGIFALVIFALYLRFLLQLPKDIARLLVVSGAMYVAGALGMEMIGGWYWEAHLTGEHTVAEEQIMIVIQTLEEALEMMGIVTFIYTLTRYAVGNGGLTFNLRSSERQLPVSH